MNFIFFNPDQMRAESLGCYGHSSVPTPHLDRLAAEGSRFDQCHIQHPVCSPSRCSFMTGWYPHVRGHRSLWHLLQPEEPNLLRYLKQAGYDVRMWGKNDLFSPRALADSVTGHDAVKGAVCGPNPFPVDDPRYYSFLYDPFLGDPDEHSDYRRVASAIEYLQSNPKGPFALYLPLIMPHAPYSAPQPWHDMMDPDSLPPLKPSGLSGKPDFYHLIRRYRRLDEVGEDHLRKIHAVYLGMIGFVDHLLGLLIEAVEASGHAEDTAIVVFSDHGDWAGDYGLVEKWSNGLDDCLTRVPLIFRVPGAPSGQVFREPVELQDFMATVLDLAGIEPEHAHFSQSLTPQILEGKPGDPDRAVFAEGGYAPHDAHAMEGRPERDEAAAQPGHIYYPKLLQAIERPESACRATMIRTMDHKLVYRPGGVHEFYDLRTDPGECNNLYGQPETGEITQCLERRMLDWLIQTSDIVPKHEDPRGH